MRIPQLKLNDPEWFPPLSSALTDAENNGLLAVGGDLTALRIISAYRQTIFPWYEEGPILWWSPNPRAVIFPYRIKISTSMSRVIRQNRFQVSWNKAFQKVVRACAEPRDAQNADTWITDEMFAAYCELHELKYAQSCEIWQNEELVGGIYGVTIGRVFFGESMFHKATNASKLALINVAKCGNFDLIDCQIPSEHVFSMGAELIDRNDFAKLLDNLCEIPDRISSP